MSIPYRKCNIINNIMIIINRSIYISNVCVYTRRPQEISIHHPPERVGPEEARKAGIEEQKLAASGGGMGEATEISPRRRVQRVPPCWFRKGLQDWLRLRKSSLQKCKDEYEVCTAESSSRGPVFSNGGGAVQAGTTDKAPA